MKAVLILTLAAGCLGYEEASVRVPGHADDYCDATDWIACVQRACPDGYVVLTRDLIECKR